MKTFKCYIRETCMLPLGKPYLTIMNLISRQKSSRLFWTTLLKKIKPLKYYDSRKTECNCKEGCRKTFVLWNNIWCNTKPLFFKPSKPKIFACSTKHFTKKKVGALREEEWGKPSLWVSFHFISLNCLLVSHGHAPLIATSK